MSETASVGRPSVYDEPVTKRNFDLPESLYQRLIDYSKSSKIPMVRIVQDALNRVLPSGPSHGQGEQGNKVSAISATGITPVDLEITLRAVFTDVFHSVPVSVDRVRRGKLQDLADQFGFASVEDLLQDLAFRAIESPKSAASFLFSQYEESAVVAAQVEDHVSKRRSTKNQKSA